MIGIDLHHTWNYCVVQVCLLHPSPDALLIALNTGESAAYLLDGINARWSLLDFRLCPKLQLTGGARAPSWELNSLMHSHAV